MNKIPAVRSATPADAPAIVEFNLGLAKETEGKALPLERLTAGVRSLFNRPEYGSYLVAEADGRIAGSLMITYEWSDWRNGVYWWIQSVYVRPEFRRRGVYRALYAEVQKRASEAGDVAGIRLYVETENVKAQETYRNLGMEECHYKMFETLFAP